MTRAEPFPTHEARSFLPGWPPVTAWETSSDHHGEVSVWPDARWRVGTAAARDGNISADQPADPFVQGGLIGGKGLQAGDRAQAVDGKLTARNPLFPA